MKIFNIAGPCNPKNHYMVPAIPRLEGVEYLIKAECYFLVHAPRQTGKTTCVKQFTKAINAKGEKYAVYCSLEKAAGIDDLEASSISILTSLKKQISLLPVDVSELKYDLTDLTSAVQSYISGVCKLLDKPLVLFLDEIDSLADRPLLTLLRQLRDGYINRDEVPFPASIALVGMRNIRDYKVKIRLGSETLGSASPFNVITKAMSLNTFSLDDIKSLYMQHTADTGQIFEDGVFERVFYWTGGQPWLVNALAEKCISILTAFDTSIPITVEMIDMAEQIIVKERGTHIDSLLSRLREPRVQRVIQPMLTGMHIESDSLNDDVTYATEIGLVKPDDITGILVPANRMYAEIMPRYLSYSMQMRIMTTLPNIPWVRENGLDIDGLLKGFQQFWRENSEIATGSVENYTEAMPHLTLQAFLQRVINGGGRLQREYALGRKRLDLLVEFRGGRYPVELKIKGSSSESESLEQILGYMEVCGEKHGWLVIIDKSPLPWDVKIAWSEQIIGDRIVSIVRA